MANAKQSKMNTQISEEAAEWFVNFRAGDVDAAARVAFNEWLRRGPEYVRAYLEFAAIWHEGAKLDAEYRYSTDELIALAGSGDNVVELGVPSAAAETARASAGGVRRWALAAAAVLAVVGVIAWLQVNQDVYRTATGEQRSLALADGSKVQLNSRSAIRVRYSGPERRIELLAGQALFDVAKDATRPFVVASDDALVRAIGTQFDVYRRAAGTRVTVVEGRVEVRSPKSPNSFNLAGAASSGTSVLLAAGDQVTVSPDTPPERVRANVSAATAWTERRLIFDSASLEDVAEEFNRYNNRQIVLSDTDIVDFHISGVFSSTDPASLIRFLHERRGIEVEEIGNEIRISRPGVSTR